MIVEKRHWTAAGGWKVLRGALAPEDAQLVLVFGARTLLAEDHMRHAIRAFYPKARIVGCSTSGEIVGAEVADDSVVTLAMQFSRALVRVEHRALSNAEDSMSIGRQLAIALAEPELAHVLVFSDGIHVNGTALVNGLRSGLPAEVMVTGGLAGDGSNFEQTLILLDDECLDREVVAVGLYGESLKIGHGSLGGWDPFGPERVITRSRGNILYELDGAPALALYKSYLGLHANELPNSGLLFPLSIRESESARPLVRTILGIDEEAGSLTFAGDMPEGFRAQLMKANVDRLVDGAHGAALAAADESHSSPALALLISCVGRKLVLKQRVEEELEAVRDVLGDDVAMIGFYSYGEIAPASDSRCSELHNQTMTITTIDER